MNRHAGRSAGAGRDFTGPIAWMARHSIASNLLMILHRSRVSMRSPFLK